MRVLGTVGWPGSGKGEAAAVAEAAGVPVVTMGDVIRDECRDRGLDPAKHHGAVARSLREEHGETAIVDRTIERLEALDSAAALVDGLRSPAELDRFREAFGERFTLVAVEAPFETRADRLAERGRDASDADRERLRERDEREREFGLGETIELADVRIDNTGSIEGFRERIRSLLAEITDGVEPSDDATGGDGLDSPIDGGETDARDGRSNGEPTATQRGVDE